MQIWTFFNTAFSVDSFAFLLNALPWWTTENNLFSTHWCHNSKHRPHPATSLAASCRRPLVTKHKLDHWGNIAESKMWTKFYWLNSQWTLTSTFPEFESGPCNSLSHIKCGEGVRSADWNDSPFDQNERQKSGFERVKLRWSSFR